MIKKIGILTFHAAHNYGSMLQAYALQTFLKQYGIEVEAINLRIPAQKQKYRHPLRYWGPRSIVRRIKSPINEFDSIVRWHRFENFLKQYISTTQEEYSSWEAILHDIMKSDYEAIICGGDQIWNTRCVDFSESYLLPGDIGKIKKLSYAPSIGGLLTDVNIEYLSEKLDSFDVICVREKQSAELLTNVLQRKIVDVADPVLLLDVHAWEAVSLCRKNAVEEYIFSYSPLESKIQDSVSSFLSYKLNLPLVTPRAAGPREFLGLVINASFIVGYSFHLIVFAIIFHKDFIAVNPKKENRIENFLEKLQLNDRSVDSLESIPQSLPFIDWPKTDQLLKQYSNEGSLFLKTMIGVD